jgi:hypothetical protein
MPARNAASGFKTTCGNVLTLSPPLTDAEANIDEALCHSRRREWRSPSVALMAASAAMFLWSPQPNFPIRALRATAQKRKPIQRSGFRSVQSTQAPEVLPSPSSSHPRRSLRDTADPHVQERAKLLGNLESALPSISPACRRRPSLRSCRRPPRRWEPTSASGFAATAASCPNSKMRPPAKAWEGSAGI